MGGDNHSEGSLHTYVGWVGKGHSFFYKRILSQSRVQEKKKLVPFL